MAVLPLVFAVMVSVSGCRSNPVEGRRWDSSGFVLVIGGTVPAGSDFAAPVEDRQVSSFWMSDHEVTQSEWYAVMGSNPSYFQGEGNPPPRGEARDLRPVEQVGWYDVLVYCNRRSMREGLEPVYSINGSTNPDDWGEVRGENMGGHWNAGDCDTAASGYRLPTEVEWEYAARGGSPNASAWNYRYAGSDRVDEVAWCLDNSGGETHEVRRKRPNSLGLYDMSGNVWEWCWTPSRDGSANHYGRGGAWFSIEDRCSVTSRSHELTSNRHNLLGFRVVRNAD